MGPYNSLEEFYLIKQGDIVEYCIPAEKYNEFRRVRTVAMLYNPLRRAWMSDISCHVDDDQNIIVDYRLAPGASGEISYLNDEGFVDIVKLKAHAKTIPVLHSNFIFLSRLEAKDDRDMELNIRILSSLYEGLKR